MYIFLPVYDTSKAYLSTIVTFKHFINFLFSAVSVPKFTDFYFSVEPTNVIAIRDQSAIFDCAVFVGEITPNVEITPTIEWIKDGQKLNLQDDNRRFVQCISMKFYYFHQ